MAKKVEKIFKESLLKTCKVEKIILALSQRNNDSHALLTNKKYMNINDHVYFKNGQWFADYTYRTTKSPERNYGTGTTHYLTTHKSGLEAALTLRAYCDLEGIPYSDGVDDKWVRYYQNADAFYKRMTETKPDPSDKKAMSDWDMAYSCDAPNKPGYSRANND